MANNVVIKNFVDFLAVQNKLNTVSYQLKKLNIIVDSHGVVDFTFPDYIKEAIAKDEAEACFYWQLPLAEKVALALACTEEDRNNHIDDDEIDFVNLFFGFHISREDVSRLHGKYV